MQSGLRELIGEPAVRVAQGSVAGFATDDGIMLE
jgi:hypothetical protein